MRKPPPSSQNLTAIIIAFIGVIGSVGVAYFAFRGNTAPIELSISTTQTAEEKGSADAQSLETTASPPPALLPTFTTSVRVVADTRSLAGWVPNFDFSNGDGAKNQVRTIEDAIEFTYDLGREGYITITKSLSSRALADTAGIRFSYKGMGAPSTLEFKLMLRYSGDTEDTTYGILWLRATNTDDEWLQVDVLYTDMQCWWPQANCNLHRDLLDTTLVDRLEFAVSNKVEDDEGSGWVLIKDVIGISP